MGFLCIVADLVIFINALDKISTWSVRLTSLRGIFTRTWDDLIEFDDKWMSELKQVIKLSIGAFGIGDVLIGVAYLFDREYLMGLFVFDFVDLTVGALAE